MKITLYTRPGCSHCDTLKNKLASMKVSFNEKDIDRYLKVLTKVYPNITGKPLPLIILDDTTLAKNEIELMKYIKEHNDPRQ